MSTTVTCPSCGYHINHPERRPYKLGPLAYHVAQLLMLGKSNGEIALIMSASEGAVKSHIRRLMDATGTGNRIALVLALTEHGVE